MLQAPYQRLIKDNASRYVHAQMLMLGSSAVANHVSVLASEKYRKLFSRAPSVVRTETKVCVQTQSKVHKFNTVRNFFTASWSEPFDFDIFERNPRLIKSEPELAPRPLSYRVVLRLLLALPRSYGPDDNANIFLYIEPSENTSIRSPYPRRSLKHTAVTW